MQTSETTELTQKPDDYQIIHRRNTKWLKHPPLTHHLAKRRFSIYFRS